MQPTIKIDLNQWSYNDFNRFVASVSGHGDANLKFELADKVLVSWSYETPIQEGIEALPSLTEALKVVSTILKTVEDFTDTVEVEGVDLDLSKWTLKRYKEFNETRAEVNHRKAEKMLHEVAKLKGTSPDKPLTAVEGARMMRAVSEAVIKGLKGKN